MPPDLGMYDDRSVPVPISVSVGVARLAMPQVVDAGTAVTTTCSS
jgi:hypothetical protein